MPRICKDKERQIIYDDIIFTKDSRTGYYLSSCPIGGKRIRLHRYIWIKNNGDIPKGYQVHHKDHDKDNNTIENLSIVPMAKHMQYHSLKDAVEHYEEKRERFINKAIPKAIEWHKSDKGKEFHKTLSEENWIKIKSKEPKKLECTVCNKSYETYFQGETKYCSKACKAKALRKRFKETGRDYEYGRCKNRKN